MDLLIHWSLRLSCRLSSLSNNGSSSNLNSSPCNSLHNLKNSFLSNNNSRAHLLSPLLLLPLRLLVLLQLLVFPYLSPSSCPRTLISRCKPGFCRWFSTPPFSNRSLDRCGLVGKCACGPQHLPSQQLIILVTLLLFSMPFALSSVDLQLSSASLAFALVAVSVSIDLQILLVDWKVILTSHCDYSALRMLTSARLLTPLFRQLRKSSARLLLSWILISLSAVPVLLRRSQATSLVPLLS